MTTFDKDLDFGLTQEEAIITKIEKFFNDKLTKTDKFCKFDFQGEETIYEVKSRNIDSQRFYTTILPQDKIIKDKKIAPKVKFFCIMLLKDLSETNNKQFMTYLEKKILKRLVDFAKL